MGPNGIMAARSNGGVTLSSNPPTYTARFEERIEGSEAAVAEAIMKFDYCRFFEDSIAIDIVGSIGTGFTEVGVKDIKEWGNCVGFSCLLASRFSNALLLVGWIFVLESSQFDPRERTTDDLKHTGCGRDNLAF